MAQDITTLIYMMLVSVCWIGGQCETPACNDDPTGVNYRGNLSQTINNHTCQQWTSQLPHDHTRTPTNYPNAGLGDHNYCRNPDGEATAWCYTNVVEIRWEYCAIGYLDPICQVITTMDVPSTHPTTTTFPVQQVTSQTPADVFPNASPLGIESGAIPDSSFSASSMYNSDHGPWRGRLNIAREGNLRGGWSSVTEDTNQFIQVDLLTTYRIIGVATQGRQDFAQWVTSFKISCSLDGVAFDTVKDPVNATVDKIFPGNSDQDTVVYNRLPVSTLCRYVRLLPYTWQAWVSLRMELYGEGPIEETPACEEDPTGVNFRGNLSQTINNHTCQQWTSQYPQSHTRTPANYPNAGLGDHNYCRNPDDSDTAWCYTTLAGIRWEYCAVGFLDPRCQVITTINVPSTSPMTTFPVQVTSQTSAADQNTTFEPEHETTQTPLSGTNQFATAPLTPTEAPLVTSATTLHSTVEYYENSTSSLTNETSLSTTTADETTVHLETTQIDQGTTITSTHPATVSTALKTSGHPQTQLINNETPTERTITTNVWTSPKETTPPPLKGLWKALAEMNNAETVSFGISLSMVLYFVSMILALTVRCIMIWIKGLRKREVKLDIERPRRMYELVNF